jgi:hypothetical protein
MSNVIEDFCQKHGIGAQTLIDVYTDNLDRIVDSVQFPNHGVELIAEERKRQVEVEKWDYKHDADYKHGELIGAATCYAMKCVKQVSGRGNRKGANLVIAGALIAAQIDLQLESATNE